MHNPNTPGYIQNLLEQPQAIRDTLADFSASDALRGLVPQLHVGLRAVILTGMGASYFALHPLMLKLVAHGIHAQCVETSELLYHQARLLDAPNLVIAVSQSGESAEIVKLAERHRAGNFLLLGVTNTLESTLAAASDAVVLTRAGAEYSVSSKTYVATLAALELLGTVLVGQVDQLVPQTPRVELEQAANAMETYLAHWQVYVAALVEQFREIETVVLVGRGSSLAAVGTGALILREAARMPSIGMSSAALRHGPMELISPRLFVLVFEGNPPTIELNRRLVDDIRALGGHAALVSASNEQNVFALPHASPDAMPLLEILVPQMMSLALARLRGLTPGEFQFGSKITRTE